MNGVVLSLFSGVGALDEAFRLAGYSVVSAGDIAWSSLFDVRNFHPVTGMCEGMISGDPCQSHSALANLVRAKGLEPSFPDMTPELCRVVEEARPRWFLRENVPAAPDIKPAGYDVRTFLLDNSTLDSGDGCGHEQMRRRRFWFGTRDAPCPELRAHIDFALYELPATQVVTSDPRAVPVMLGGSGKVKRTAVDTSNGGGPCSRRQSVTSRHDGAIGVTGGHAGNPPRYSLEEMLALQGLPLDLFAYSPLTVQGKRKLVGNAVPLMMGCALARAIAVVMR